MQRHRNMKKLYIRATIGSSVYLEHRVYMEQYMSVK